MNSCELRSVAECHQAGARHADESGKRACHAPYDEQVILVAATRIDTDRGSMVNEAITAELALLCALDKVEDQLRVVGWPQDETPEWSLTYGRHSVYATASFVDGAQGRRISMDATTGFLPWRRRELHRVIALG